MSYILFLFLRLLLIDFCEEPVILFYLESLKFTGPACSDTVEPLAGVASHFETIIISYSAEGAIFNDEVKYPLFFRTIPENIIFKWVTLIDLLMTNYYHVTFTTYSMLWH